MPRGLSPLCRVLLATAVLAVAAPSAAQQNPPPAADASVALPQELSFDGLFTVRYPGTWSELPSVYRNSRTLVSVPRSDHGRLSAADNAHGVGPRVARVMITVEQRRSHAEAVQRLRDIAGSVDSPATYLEIGGWPALEQSHLAERPLRGQSPLRQNAPLAGRNPDRLTLHHTTAIAAGSLLIRLEASMPPNGSERMQQDAQAIGRSVVAASAPPQADAAQPAGGSEGMAAALAALRAFEASRPRPGAADTTLPASVAVAASETAAVADVPGPGFPARAVTGGSEISMAASTSGRFVVIGSNGGYSFSSDAGRTWTEAGIACPAGFTACNGDPSLAVGLSGAFYYAIIGWPTGANTQDPNGTASTVIYSSTNNGQTFNFVNNAVVCNNGGAGSCFPDQEHITADRVLPGAGGGDQVYSVWRNFDATDQDPALVCSQDGGQNWTAPLNVGAGFVPRIGIGGDGFVYVVYRSGNNIMLHKYSPCSAGLTPQAGFPVTVTGVTDVTCPVAGLDRCNDGNILSSHTVAVDDVNPQRVYVSYATNTAAGLNENVFVRVSTDGGATFSAPTQVNSTGNARRYMPWVCSVGGAAYVTWYDRRFGIAGISDDFTDFYGGSVRLDAGGTLVAGPEFRISGVSDANCGSGWPCAPRATGDSESCPVQPQLAGVCRDNNAATADSNQRCDFSTGPACPAGETCQTGGGCPKYGDYNGNACAGGRLFMAWASVAAPPGVPAGGSIDTFTDNRVVCCVPQIQTSGALDFGSACGGTPVTRPLEICNQGKELLTVTGITSSNPQYTVAAPVPGYPFDITAGNCQTMQVTFSPTVAGPVNATLNIASNDPVYPTLTVNLSGTSGSADVNLTGSGDFGAVCAGATAERSINVCNTGTCPLSVSGVAVDCPHFAIVNNPFPASVGVSECLPVTVKYTPQSLGTHTCNLVVTTGNDPDEPQISIPLVASTPAPQLTLGPDLAFPPTVIQSVGACQSSLPVLITNTGQCPATVNSITIGGVNAAEYSLAGAPGLPVTISPGEQVGEGDLLAVFRPQELDRDRIGSLSVNWLANPIALTTATLTSQMCGEGVRTGARVLVRVGGAPAPVVDRIQIQRITANRNRKIVDTVDTSLNLALQTWTPEAGTACQPFAFHKEYGTVDSPLMLAPGSYTVTATVTIGRKKSSKTVAFDTNTCGFNPTVVIDF